MFLLIRQRFTDYRRWREAFDSLTDVRREAGMTPVVVSRNVGDPHEVVVVFSVADQEQAKRHAGSDALRQAHQRGGVVEGSTEVTFLQDVDD